MKQYWVDLFEDEFDWREEWKDMPEYINEDLSSERQIVVHFRNEEDIQKFAELIEQQVTELTKSLWYPYMADRLSADKLYIDEINKTNLDLFEDNGQ